MNLMAKEKTMNATKSESVPTISVEQQARICAEWLDRMISREFTEAQRLFESDVKHDGYAAALERSMVRLLRAEMQKTMLRLITEACGMGEPIFHLETTKAQFQRCLLETVKRNDGSPEEERVQALRAESQGSAVNTIDAILTALRAAEPKQA